MSNLLGALVAPFRRTTRALILSLMIFSLVLVHRTDVEAGPAVTVAAIVIHVVRVAAPIIVRVLVPATYGEAMVEGAIITGTTVYCLATDEDGNCVEPKPATLEQLNEMLLEQEAECEGEEGLGEGTTGGENHPSARDAVEKARELGANADKLMEDAKKLLEELENSDPCGGNDGPAAPSSRSILETIRTNSLPSIIPLNYLQQLDTSTLSPISGTQIQIYNRIHTTANIAGVIGPDVVVAGQLKGDIGDARTIGLPFFIRTMPNQKAELVMLGYNHVARLLIHESPYFNPAVDMAAEEHKPTSITERVKFDCDDEFGDAVRRLLGADNIRARMPELAQHCSW